MTSSSSKINWQGKWITSDIMPSDGLIAPLASVDSRGAPWLRSNFVCSGKSHAIGLYIAAPGWFECYINGMQVGDQVLSPIVTQFTERVSYLFLDITGFVDPGENAIAVLLGNGWYNCQTGDVWHFHDAPWRNLPSLLLQIEELDTGKVLLSSGPHWKAAKSPVVLNALRNGEWQDTRIDDTGISLPTYDDSQAPNACIANPPPGILTQEECESCVIAKHIAPVKSWRNGEWTVYDFGKNLTGWCEFDAHGPAGQKVILRYGERITDSGELTQSVIDPFCKTGRFQEDRYILNGAPMQKSLHPHFTYHGFRYVAVFPNDTATPDQAEIQNLTACFIHNDFANAGEFHTSHKMLDKIQQVNRHTYLCNYTGIPTDCPHREKNGWTGDANLAFETGAWNFHTKDAARHFAQLLMDCQRPSGQLPGIAPTGGWGYNWGSGPAWDSYIFEAAYQNWMMAGDDSILRTHYEGMKRYLDYCRQWHDIDGVVDFGLGDWCPFRQNSMPAVALTSTGFYYQDTLRMREFAKYLGNDEDEKFFTAEAKRIRAGVNKRFAHTDGGYDNDSLTALATPLYFGFAKSPKKTLNKLVKLLREVHHISDYGILGAKFVPRVLGENGLQQDLLTLLTQPEMPGWGYWMNLGATTFREQWNGNDSQDHIMFGDPSACIFRYLAGITPTSPGFKDFSLTPAVDLEELTDFDCSYESPYGVIQSTLKTTKKGNRIYSCTIPKGTNAKFVSPKTKECLSLAQGYHEFRLKK